MERSKKESEVANAKLIQTLERGNAKVIAANTQIIQVIEYAKLYILYSLRNTFYLIQFMERSKAESAAALNAKVTTANTQIIQVIQVVNVNLIQALERGQEKSDMLYRDKVNFERETARSEQAIVASNTANSRLKGLVKAVCAFRKPCAGFESFHD